MTIMTTTISILRLYPTAISIDIFTTKNEHAKTGEETLRFFFNRGRILTGGMFHAARWRISPCVSLTSFSFFGSSGGTRREA